MRIFYRGYVILYNSSPLIFFAYFITEQIFRSSCFNIDLKTAVFHEGIPGSMFGYAVSQHTEHDTGWLLIGAPLAQTAQPKVEKGGAVYRCHIQRPNSCVEIAFDFTGPKQILYQAKYQDSDNKSFQWFGATVHSTGGGVVVACAPRYVYYGTTIQRREPVGACFTARTLSGGFTEYSPCRTSAWGYHRQGSCELGFSAAVSTDGTRLFMGAVGGWYWQGQIFSQNLFVRDDLKSTREGPPTNDDGYMGYSMAVGEFSGDTTDDIAVGMPRGNKLTGKVIIFDSSLTHLGNISGEQMGSYFGYSICVADVDGNGLDDIIIGAPFYKDPLIKDGSYDVGRVYIYHQHKKQIFQKFDVLDGKKSTSRFGLAVTSVGDLNFDGFVDFAVGAPYDGPNNRGAIYIYHGARKSIGSEHSQVIFAEEVNKHLKTFGYSLSGGSDLDRNSYPDLLVGAYSSDRVIFLRSRPIVTLTASLKVDPEIINLDEKSCNLGNGSVVSCVVVSTCLEFTGIGVPSRIEIKLSTKLDIEKEKNSRAFFLSIEGESNSTITVPLSKDSLWCKSIYVYLKNGIRDKLTPIVVEMKYDMIDRKPRATELKPILNQDVSSLLKKSVNILKNCGKDNECIPDLRIQARSNKLEYLIGRKDNIILDVIIDNLGEDAFEALFVLIIPAGLDYVKVENMQPAIPVTCSGPFTENITRNEVKCDLGNPLPSLEMVHIKVHFSPTQINGSIGEIIFILEANSTNSENASTQIDNFLLVEIPIKVIANIAVTGVSKPESVSFRTDFIIPDIITDESQIGPELKHVYQVDNLGPSKILTAEVHLLWPTFTKDDKHLLYLLEEPKVIGPGVCKPARGKNPLNIQIRSFSEEGVLITTEKKEVLERKSRDLSDLYQSEMFCGPTNCSIIACTIGPLDKGESVVFEIRGRVWLKTLFDLGYTDVSISSKAMANVISVPYAVQPDRFSFSSYLVKTQIISETFIHSRASIPWWIISISVTAGIVLLILLILLLWKLGFFKRKRAKDAEKEALHKKGAELNGNAAYD